MTSQKVTRIDSLTDAQKARFAEWSDKWIEIGLRTGPANRALFEESAKKCYEFAGIPWPGRVVWVSSPIVMSIAAPVAALLIQIHKSGTLKRGAVRDAVRSVISKMWTNYMGGQFWVGGWWWGGAVTSFFREVCGLELDGDLWDRGRAYEGTLQSTSWWHPHRDFVMACERPLEIHRELVREDNPRGWGSHRLHRTDGPAVSWPDGWGVYAVHGARVPGWIIDHPERITVSHIEGESNAEVRRLMIERYGWSRYIADCGAQIVDQVAETHEIRGLRGARLLRKELPGEPEAIIYLDMINSTPEPDGSLKHYLERIDPKAYEGDAAKSCHAAMASRWRYRDDSGELQLTFPRWQAYRPTAES